MESRAGRNFAGSSHFIWLPLIALAAVMGAALAAAPRASAEVVLRERVHTFSEKSPLEEPRQAAAAVSTGHTFMVEETTGMVYVFKPVALGAELLTTFGTGILQKPFGIAVDESGPQTRVYVSDAGLEEIVRFVSDGQPTPTFTVDATYTSPAQGGEAGQIESFASPLALAPNGDLWVADRGANVVKRFDPDGNHVAGSNFDGSGSPEGAFTGLLDIAANSEGDLYIVDASGEIMKSEGTSRVQRFGEDGEYKATIGPLGPDSRSGTVAVNQADDSIAVTGDQDAIATGKQVHVIYRFDAENNPLEGFILPPTNFPSLGGASHRGTVIVPGFRNRYYFVGGRSYNSSGKYEAGSLGVVLASDKIPPQATIDPVSSVGSTEATISGTVDANGASTEWRVEYRQTGELAWQLGPASDAGSDVDPVAVSRALTGLSPGTAYEVRIAATSADGTAQTGVESLTTESVAPEILRERSRPGSDTAKLLARIHPGGAETTYWFEYGPTSSLGHSTEPATIPPGAAPVNVFADIDGLSPSTTYHFRVIAENVAGKATSSVGTFSTLPASCPNEALRTGLSAELSECGAYELVTPSGSTADIRLAPGASTPDGDAVCFNSEDRLVDAQPNGKKTVDDGYCSWRTADGWRTEWVTGPAVDVVRGSRGANVYFLSNDGNRAVFATDVPIFGNEWLAPPGNETIPVSAYMWEAGQTTWIAPAELAGEPPEPVHENSTTAQRRPLAASDDARYVLFESNLKLVPEDENSLIDVYMWTPEGLRVASTDSDGKAAGGRVPRGSTSFAGTVLRAHTGSISASGHRVFFEHAGAPIIGTEPAGVRSVYMREGNTISLVSPRLGSGPDQDVYFAGASADGDTVYLATTQQLTAEPKQSGEAVYRYEVSDEDLELVTTTSGGVQFLDNSRDGSTFVYRELATQRLAVNHHDTDITLGTASPLDGNFDYKVASGRFDQRALRITPDGKALVFASNGQFDGPPGLTVTQIYRWALGEGVENVSAPRGKPQTAQASIGSYASQTQFFPNGREEVLAQNQLLAQRGRVISDDGRRIFFETTEALVERDTNEARDVYEWRDGVVELVSSGKGTGSWYHENSADGRTVFILTYDRVIPELDRNTNRDLYAVRSEGGFPIPRPPAPCAGEACQGQVDPPVAREPGRAADGGNVVVVGAPRIMALGKKQIARLARGGKMTVRVKVAAPGRVTALLRGRLKGRNAVVGKAVRSVKRKGTVRLGLRLSKAARRQLARRGKLRLDLRVRHSRSDQAARKVVMLRG